MKFYLVVTHIYDIELTEMYLKTLLFISSPIKALYFKMIEEGDPVDDIDVRDHLS